MVSESKANHPPPRVKTEIKRRWKPSHTLFAQELANGSTQAAAFRRAFPKSKANSCNRKLSVAAWKLAHRPDVIAYVEKLRVNPPAPVLWGLLERDQKRLELAKIVLDANEDPAIRMRAIELDNKMAGHEAPRTTMVFSQPMKISQELIRRFAEANYVADLESAVPALSALSAPATNDLPKPEVHPAPAPENK